MTRAVSVVAAVIVLLAVGWFFGHRPVSHLQRNLEAERAACADQAQALQDQARTAEARGQLWTVEGALVLAARDVEARNFGTASERVARARDLLAAATEVLALAPELESVQEGVAAAMERIQALDPAAGEVLLRAAQELNGLLESVG
jgi:hypothetical protein